MIPKQLDSLELVELLMGLEEFFDVEIADEIGSAREIVDYLESRLSYRRPNKQAARFLKELAKKTGNPELAQGLDGLWRREQIAAISGKSFELRSSSSRLENRDCAQPLLDQVRPVRHG